MSVSVNKVTCGVIGVGHLGIHHARLYSELENAERFGLAALHQLRLYGKVNSIQASRDVKPFQLE